MEDTVLTDTLCKLQCDNTCKLHCGWLFLIRESLNQGEHM